MRSGSALSQTVFFFLITMASAESSRRRGRKRRYDANDPQPALAEAKREIVTLREQIERQRDDLEQQRAELEEERREVERQRKRVKGFQQHFQEQYYCPILLGPADFSSLDKVCLKLGCGHTISLGAAKKWQRTHVKYGRDPSGGRTMTVEVFQCPQCRRPCPMGCPDAVKVGSAVAHFCGPCRSN